MGKLFWKLKKENCFVFLVISLFINSCGPRIQPPPPTEACTFNLSNIFTNCFNPKNSSNRIRYTVNLVVRYYRGGNYRNILDEKNVSSTTPGGSSIAVESELPTDNTAYEYEITISGMQCSTCALTSYGTDICLQITSPSGTTAAFPRLQFIGSGVGHRPSINVSNFIPIQNVQMSCGCLVPN